MGKNGWPSISKDKVMVAPTYNAVQVNVVCESGYTTIKTWQCPLNVCVWTDSTIFNCAEWMALRADWTRCTKATIVIGAVSTKGSIKYPSGNLNHKPANPCSCAAASTKGSTSGSSRSHMGITVLLSLVFFLHAVRHGLASTFDH